jgi:hypothetical protein
MHSPYKVEAQAFAIGHGGAAYGSSNYMQKLVDSNGVIIHWYNHFLNPLPPELVAEIAKLYKSITMYLMH